MTVSEAISASGIDVREARLLLAEVAGFSIASIAASMSEEVPFEVEQAFLELAEKRKLGIPVAYLLGHQDAADLPTMVDLGDVVAAYPDAVEHIAGLRG